jgi:uncharacterized membrane protein YadS
MSGIFFYFLVIVFAIIPILITLRMKVSDKKRYWCAFLSPAIPIFTIIFMRILTSTGLINGAPYSENMYVQSATWLVILGPWLPLLIVALFYKREL